MEPTIFQTPETNFIFITIVHNPAHAMYFSLWLTHVCNGRVARVRILLFSLVLITVTGNSHGLSAATLRVMKDGSAKAMTSLRVRPALKSAMLSIHNRVSLRGGSAFGSSTSCDHFHQSEDENELHQQLVALGGVDITSIIRRQPSCEELRDYLLPLVGRKSQVNMK